jgi:hypothetical protein
MGPLEKKGFIHHEPQAPTSPGAERAIDLLKYVESLFLFEEDGPTEAEGHPPACLTQLVDPDVAVLGLSQDLLQSLDQAFELCFLQVTFENGFLDALAVILQ